MVKTRTAELIQANQRAEKRKQVAHSKAIVLTLSGGETRLRGRSFAPATPVRE